MNPLSLLSLSVGALASVAFASLWLAAEPPPPSGPDVTDYLIQNVCVDQSDRPIEGDPAVCAKARDAKPGEVPPYSLSDYDRAYDKRYQTNSSLPQADGRVMVTKRLESGSGFDLIEHEGAYVSIVRTEDGGCGEQTFSGAGDGDGWLLFPTALPSEGGNVRSAMRVERLAPPSQCPNRNRVSWTWGREINIAWSPPRNTTFESGKTLLAIRTEHQAHYDQSRLNNAMEVFYFTREYGFSRWEAWLPEARCLKEREANWCRPEAPDSPLRGRCRPDTAREIRGGQAWVRVDCRDTTFYQPGFGQGPHP